MIDLPFGRCPMCSEELKLEGPLLVCPTGEYKAEGRAFEARWHKYFKDVEALGRIQAGKDLLRDLKAINIKDSNEKNI